MHGRQMMVTDVAYQVVSVPYRQAVSCACTKDVLVHLRRTWPATPGVYACDR
jgi:hypothetical protein